MLADQLSSSHQNYVKTVWKLHEWSGEPVSASQLADALKLRRSTVSDAIKKLTEQGYFLHSPYGGILLTEVGQKVALEMVRRHRLIEMFLVKIMGYTWQQVHDEAERLEHAVSDFMVARMDELLGYPTRDPHGDPIPDAGGVIHMPVVVRFDDVVASAASSSFPEGADALLVGDLSFPAGSREGASLGRRVSVVLERVNDENSALLELCAQQGIACGQVLEVTVSHGQAEVCAVYPDPSDESRQVLLSADYLRGMWVSAPQ